MPLPSCARIIFPLAAFVCVCSCSHTTSQQPPPPKPPLEFIGAWGTRGDGPGQLQLPVTLTTDAFGNVFIADQESKFIHKFDPSGRPLLAFEVQGSKNAHSIAVDSGGAIYLGSPGGGISIFLPNGDFLRTVRGLKAPADALAVDQEGNIYSLSVSGFLQKLSPRGKSLGIWGKRRESKGEFAYPTALALSADGFLYVADMGNYRIQKLTREGEFAALWHLSAAEDVEPPAITGLATYKDFLFLLVLHQGQYMLEVWSLDGKQILSDPLGGRLNPAGKVAPCIATSPKGELLVLDAVNARVLRFRINL